MGYAGYVPAKMPPATPTPVEAAVGAVKSMDTLEVLQKLIYNAAVAPKDEKFRRLRLSNEKINTVIVQVPGAVEALQALGWEQSEDLEFMIMGAGVYANMAQVRVIEAAKERLKKAAEEAHKDRLRQAARASAPAAGSGAAPANAAVKVTA